MDKLDLEIDPVDTSKMESLSDLYVNGGISLAILMEWMAALGQEVVLKKYSEVVDGWYRGYLRDVTILPRQGLQGVEILLQDVGDVSKTMSFRFPEERGYIVYLVPEEKGA